MKTDLPDNFWTMRYAGNLALCFVGAGATVIVGAVIIYKALDGQFKKKGNER